MIGRPLKLNVLSRYVQFVSNDSQQRDFYAPLLLLLPQQIDNPKEKDGRDQEENGNQIQGLTPGTNVLTRFAEPLF